MLRAVATAAAAVLLLSSLPLLLELTPDPQAAGAAHRARHMARLAELEKGWAAERAAKPAAKPAEGKDAMSGIWTRDGSVLVDGNSVIVCDDCPCEDDRVSIAPCCPETKLGRTVVAQVWLWAVEAPPLDEWTGQTGPAFTLTYTTNPGTLFGTPLADWINLEPGQGVWENLLAPGCPTDFRFTLYCDREDAILKYIVAKPDESIVAGGTIPMVSGPPPYDHISCNPFDALALEETFEMWCWDYEPGWDIFNDGYDQYVVLIEE
jgi:hypothetical protein